MKAMKRNSTLLTMALALTLPAIDLSAQENKDQPPPPRGPRYQQRDGDAPNPPREGDGPREGGPRDGGQRRQFPGGPGGQAGGQPMEGQRPPTPPLMAALDTDNDGVISEKEISAATKSLKKLDKNKDGKLTADELRPAGGMPGMRPPHGDGFRPGGQNGPGPNGQRPPRDGDLRPDGDGPRERGPGGPPPGDGERPPRRNPPQGEGEK
jgi:hypothetical protein